MGRYQVIEGLKRPLLAMPGAAWIGASGKVLVRAGLVGDAQAVQGIVDAPAIAQIVATRAGGKRALRQRLMDEEIVGECRAVGEGRESPIALRAIEPFGRGERLSHDVVGASAAASARPEALMRPTGRPVLRM